MKEKFEYKFMELQKELISLCLEIVQDKVDDIFIYASIEKKSTMFNAFFEKSGRVITINQLCIEPKRVLGFLRVGTMELEKIKTLFGENEMKAPTEIKIYYSVKSGKMKADYKYEEVCSWKTGVSSGEVFMEWMDNVKRA